MSTVWIGADLAKPVVEMAATALPGRMRVAPHAQPSTVARALRGPQMGPEIRLQSTLRYRKSLALSRGGVQIGG